MLAKRHMGNPNMSQYARVSCIWLTFAMQNIYENMIPNND